MRLSRRGFLKLTGAAGLLLGFELPVGRGGVAEAADVKKAGPFQPNAFLQIDPDGTVTVKIHKAEMGQGVVTSLSMIIAEHLEADWSRVKTVFAAGHPDYVGPGMPLQITGGSSSVRGSWEKLAKAGATAREMLIAAAAKKWKVKPSTCRAEKGEVIHVSGKREAFGALAALAAKVPVPKSVTLKDRDFKLIGTRVARLDTPDKVRGVAEFGIDVKVPGMLTARVVRCPVFGGKVKELDATKAKASPAVKDVVQISTGVAVIADGYWPASQGVRALTVTWDEGENAKQTSAAISRAFREAAKKEGAVVRNDGDVAAAMKDAARVVEAEYEVPFLHHMTMEPMNATAHVRKGEVEIWAPTQCPTWAIQHGARIGGVPPDKVKVNVTYLGGGFGRRAEPDFIEEALECSKAVGAPVKVVWSREDDVQHGFYRPAAYSRFTAAVGKDGTPTAWANRLVSGSIMSRVFPMGVRGGVDPTSIETAADLPYGIPNVKVDYHLVDAGIPLGFWRSVGSSQNGWFTESFVDEIAAAVKKDPVELRLALLKDKPRWKQVVELAAEKAGWGKKAAAGISRGVAVVESFGSWVAQVAEISIDKGKLRVHRVVCAVDCGRFVNPDTIEAQMEGGILYGLSSLWQAITIKDGRVAQRNFVDYPVVRMARSPKVEVHIVSSTEPPGGVGEPGVPPIAPAVTNAIRAATGTPIRSLPLTM